MAQPTKDQVLEDAAYNLLERLNHQYYEDFVSEALGNPRYCSICGLKATEAPPTRGR